MASFSLSLGVYGLEHLLGGPRGYMTAAQTAEQAGFDMLSITDHVVMGNRTDRYPYGPFPSSPEADWLEPMVSLSVMAGATERIQLSQGVLISPLRSAALLAKQAATLDAFAPGRVVMGLGTGWQREEYLASGLPFAGRKARMFEQIAAMKALWRDCPASFHGETLQFKDIYCRPAPANGDIPCWVGVKASEENCDAIAQVADGWIPIENDPEVYGEGIKALRRAFEKAGRDPATLSVRSLVATQTNSDGVPDIKATLAGIPAMLAAGVTHVEVLPIIFIQDPAALPEFCETVVRESNRYRN